jgi:hypothetical protein
MARKARIGLLVVFLLAALYITGCKLNIQQLWQKAQPDEPELMNVEMHFTSGEVVYGYVKSMGIANDDDVFNGGNSICYIYDQKGKIIGSFNYSRLEYMKLIP